MIGGVYSSSFVLFSQSHVLRSYGVASYARTQNEKKKPPLPLMMMTTTTTTMPSLFSFCSSRCFPSQFVSFLLFSSSALMMMMILNEDEKEDEDDARDRTDDHHEASSSVFSSSSSSFSFSIRVFFVRVRISWWWWYHRKTEKKALLSLYRDDIIQFFCVKNVKKNVEEFDIIFDF